MEFLSSYLPSILALIAAGVVGGLIAGLLGVGGGIIMVPAMTIVFALLGYDPEVYQHVAVGTSLAVIISTGTMSARSHYKRGAVMVDVLKLWGPFIMAFSLLGGLMAGLYSGDVLRGIFGFVALFLALNIVLPFQQKLMGRLNGSVMTNRICAGFIGYVSSLMGVGGGSFSVPTLAAFGHSMQRSVGTSSALGVLIALPGAIGFVISGWGAEGRPPLSLGYVNVPALVLIGLVAAVFAPIGAALAHKMAQRPLKLVFAAFLTVVGLRMIWQAFFGG